MDCNRQHVLIVQLVSTIAYASNIHLPLALSDLRPAVARSRDLARVERPQSRTFRRFL